MENESVKRSSKWCGGFTLPDGVREFSLKIVDGRMIASVDVTPYWDDFMPTMSVRVCPSCSAEERNSMGVLHYPRPGVMVCEYHGEMPDDRRINRKTDRQPLDNACRPKDDPGQDPSQCAAGSAGTS